MKCAILACYTPEAECTRWANRSAKATASCQARASFTPEFRRPRTIPMGAIEGATEQLMVGYVFFNVNILLTDQDDQRKGWKISSMLNAS